jgi:hypothetical protein
MNQSQITLIVIGFILVALMATNPSLEDHKEAVKEEVSNAFENNNSDANAVVEKMIKRENFRLFSLTQLNSHPRISTPIIGLGILGKVYLENRRDFKDEIKKEIDESNEREKRKSIIGFSKSLYNNLKVAQYDFPNKMNWYDAKKACEALGEDWTLPKQNQLNLLYKYGDLMLSENPLRFVNDYYWSSTEDGNKNVWIQNLVNGNQRKSVKDQKFHVRAIYYNNFNFH